ncbi:MAG: YigZ family protein [Bacteroidales bacterium]|nr:YigZ family protein [Bacteroidales bacterium]
MDSIIDTYRGIAAPSEGLFKDNYSRFISLAFPVESEKEAKSIVEEVRKKYHDAHHHCYAYRIGLSGEPWRANDDGEPSGTAGRQILGQIDSAGLSDVLIVVVRYFGGIKLGVPGLIAAYKAAAADAVANAKQIRKYAVQKYRINFSYSQMPVVMEAIKSMQLPSSGKDFGTNCQIDVKVRLSLDGQFREKMKFCNITRMK